MTAGGAPNTAGEITLSTFNAIANASNSIVINSNIKDNGTGAVTLTIGQNAGSSQSSTVVQLAGTNTYTGGTFINSGRVNYIGTTSFGTGPVTIAAGAQIFGGSLANAINLAGGGTSFADTPAAIRLGGTMSGKITLLADAAIGGGNGGTGTLSGQITGNYNLTLGRTASSGGGAGTIIVSNNSGVTPNSYTGNTILSEGIVKLGASNVIPDGSGFGNLVFSNALANASFDLAGNTETINGLASTTNGTQAGVILNSSNGATKALTVGGNDQTATFGGAIADNVSTGGTGKVSIVKTGLGTETFSGKSTFTGGLTVSGGTLFASGAAGTPATGLAGSTNSASNQTTVTLTTGTTAGLAVGQGVSGSIAAVPAGSVITNILSGTTFTISSNATATTASNNLTFTKNYDSLGTGAVTVNTGGILDLGAAIHSVAGAITLSTGTIQDGSLASSLATGTGLTISGTNTLGFNIGGVQGTTDQISINSGAIGTATGTDTVNLKILARPAATQTLTLISAPNVGSTINGATYALGAITGANTFGISFTLVPSTTALQLTETLAAAPASAYFRGNLGTSWAATSGSNTNFTDDAAGATPGTQLPGATTDVHFYAQNATTANVAASTLDQAFTIQSLTVDGTALSESAPVGIASGTGGVASTLTITPASSSVGITIGAGAGATTISAPLIIGASQTWTNSSSNALTLSGGVGDGGTARTVNSRATGATGVITVSAAAPGRSRTARTSTSPAGGST